MTMSNDDLVECIICGEMNWAISPFICHNCWSEGKAAAALADALEALRPFAKIDECEIGHIVDKDSAETCPYCAAIQKAAEFYLRCYDCRMVVSARLTKPQKRV